MAIIPRNTHTTEHRIEHSREIYQVPREYLGMSSLGRECLRKQWYAWRWSKFAPLSVRMQRLFTRGHLEEASIITDLQYAGVEVFRMLDDLKIPMTGEIGEEQEEIVGYEKHVKGHPDGRCLGVIEAPKTVHLLEMKTMNTKYFEQLKEELAKSPIGSAGQSRALKASFPDYYCQMNRYMGGMKLNRGLFVATNKNDQARKYIRIQFNKTLYIELLEREKNIIHAEKPPPRKYNATHYLCNWCGFYQICHFNVEPQRHCRTCKYADIEMQGKWSCSKKNKEIKRKRQLKGCHQYKRLF